jgi:hypothetical protein
VIGKRDFAEMSPFGEIMPTVVAKPGGVVVDRSVSPGRAYVYDPTNSRILGINLAKCYAQPYACSPDIVIGQPSGYDYGACNLDNSFQFYPERSPATASTLCGLDDGTLSPAESLSFAGMYVDSQGNLYVPDRFNNRVLKYISPFTTDTIADEVIGQENFSGVYCNKANNRDAMPTNSSLCLPGEGADSGAGVALDSAGNLWIADNQNNRVLRFPKNSVTGKLSKYADIVLGQRNFTTKVYGAAMNQLIAPTSLRFSPAGELYVADGGNRRVLVFSPPFSSGMSAYRTFGEFQGVNPAHIGEVDPSGAGLWINNLSNGDVVLYGWDGVTIKKILRGFQEDHAGSLGIDTLGNVLPAIAYVRGDVAIYNNPLANASLIISSPTRYMFSPQQSGVSTVSGRRLTTAFAGLSVVANQLVVSDKCRILFWNNLDTLTNGKPADGFVGVRDFSSFTHPDSGCFYNIKADQNNRIWIAQGQRFSVYQAPLTIGSKPIKIFNFPLNVLGGGQITSAEAMMIAPTANSEFVWITQTLNNRVLRIRDPLGANPVVDVILGQRDIYGTTCNRGLVPNSALGTDMVPELDMLCRPGLLSIDKYNNLFVSDHSLEVEGNFRLLMFSSSKFPQSSSLILAPSADKSFPKQQSPGQNHATWETAFDSKNRMVVGYNLYVDGPFLGYYNNPLGSSINPDGYFKDYFSSPYSAVFDKFDNLYVMDHTRTRVLIYKNPFNNTVNAVPDPVIPEVTTIRARIAQGSDDATSECNLDLFANELYLGKYAQSSCNKSFVAAVRFQNINIPRGAIITNAVIFFKPSDGDAKLNLVIKGIANDNAATFSSANDPAKALKTSTTVNFILDYPWYAYPYVDSMPKVTSIVQEIVNRPGWQSGNSIAFTIENAGSTSFRRMQAYDYNPDEAPDLWVQYRMP